ncbi:MAG: RNA-binding S4 domain-containing protein [Tidjanibacter sp.]|nr:RNA-binding S4 domain-containing protein [Tidjanibacter sp.]
MKTTDFPVRAHSENEESYKTFTKDKRSRTSKPQALYSTSSYNRTPKSEEAGERRSFNPNFTRDNRLIDRNRSSFCRSERSEGGYNRERNFNREDRPSFNREGGYSRERNFNREERSFNREERSFNREGRPSFNRERNFNREEGYNREERPSFNRERNFNRENNQEGGFRPRHNKFGSKPSFGHDKGGFAPKKSSGKFHSERAPKEPKPFVNTANTYTLENYPSYAAPKIEGEIRLNRYISMSGICSRREADEYITSGQITVNGEVVTELGSKVRQNDIVCYNGKQIHNEKKVYIVMNKPKGFVTTLDDPHADKSVMDLVKNACTERIYPVGRLDKNSVGVLLLTNDGDLAKKLTHPTYEKKKIYQVSLDKRLARADLERLIMGITLEDGDIAADDVCYVDDPTCKNAVGIEIHSGRNRIVRRMFEHVGYRVGKLDRVYFAGLTKQKLKRGEWRFLTEKEVSMLKSGNYE